MTVFKTVRVRALSVGREEMDVRSRRVSCTHAWRGRRSRRSEISSSGLVGTTGTGFVVLVAAVLTLAASIFLTYLQPVERLLWVLGQAS